eukprot:CAMPEP_0180543902 /NCGR_PEP_ID=MMETSP1036_2-20121128/69225_1 /TAXON_ID=632150 /ORGANISM="Azadinium spinosum, Strain 3D9" /LENGTH=72 /DNA_ID=CAMNT_0022558851 /DNA_START=264 /DNA_END=478 /DNA_ORIENTATION=-
MISSGPFAPGSGSSCPKDLARRMMNFVLPFKNEKEEAMSCLSSWLSSFTSQRVQPSDSVGMSFIFAVTVSPR